MERERDTEMQRVREMNTERQTPRFKERERGRERQGKRAKKRKKREKSGGVLLFKGRGHVHRDHPADQGTDCALGKHTGSNVLCKFSKGQDRRAQMLTLIVGIFALRGERAFGRCLAIPPRFLHHVFYSASSWAMTKSQYVL